MTRTTETLFHNRLVRLRSEASPRQVEPTLQRFWRKDCLLCAKPRIVELLLRSKPSSSRDTSGSLGSPYCQERRCSSSRSTQGFTLVEVVVVITVLSILSLLGIRYVANTSDLYAITCRQRDADSECDLAYTRIQREFRSLQSVVAATSNSIAFVEPGNVTNTIACASGNLYFNGNYLARSVTDFSFRYYDVTNGALSALPLSAADCSRVRRVGLGMTATMGTQSSVLDVNFFAPRQGVLR
jgi:prepilin-type N-terminal cleavage/methylation domain-containing protein